MKANEIHKDVQNSLGNSTPSYSTVAKWTNEFKRAMESFEDDP